MIKDRLFLTAALSVVLLDRLSKALVVARFELGERLDLLPGLALAYVRNPGAAFSLLADAPASFRKPFFLLVLVVAVAAVLWMLRSTVKEDRLTRFSLGLVLGGALGNGVDRLRFGEVIDFFLVDLGFWPLDPWPVFNVADSAVCVGVTLLLWRSFKPLKPEA